MLKGTIIGRITNHYMFSYEALLNTLLNTPLFTGGKLCLRHQFLGAMVPYWSES